MKHLDGTFCGGTQDKKHYKLFIRFYQYSLCTRSGWLGQLKKRMSELALVNLTNIPKDRVAFGSKVKVFDNTKEEEIVYTLVTSEESDVTKGLISTTSPIGKSLMGKKVGDTALVVTPNGKREMEILQLTTIHDEEP